MFYNIILRIKKNNNRKNIINKMMILNKLMIFNNKIQKLIKNKIKILVNIQYKNIKKNFRGILIKNNNYNLMILINNNFQNSNKN